MSSESLSDSSLLFFDETQVNTGTLAVAGGDATVVVRQSPERSTGNQDAAAIVQLSSEAAVLAVADGVGGTPGGRQAAEAAIRELEAAIRNVNEEVKLRTAIIDGIEHANRAVLELGTGAATTLAAVEIQGATIRPYHVGDSGVLVTGQHGKLKLQTVSHSPVGFAVESGLIDRHDAIHHADLHYISNLIGTNEMRIEIGASLDMARYDTLVVATDGLLDNLSLDEIIDLSRKGPLDNVGKRLVDAAEARMKEPTPGEPSKPDDLACILFRLARPGNVASGSRAGVN